mmetsp:Transcript_5080/g.10588  ORF Transcript_5080/g.10588 Transcript_5080/m.10588 type:complete len:92 (+) Transcript_5080:1607-1882(+)
MMYASFSHVDEASLGGTTRDNVSRRQYREELGGNLFVASKQINQGETSKRDVNCSGQFRRLPENMHYKTEHAATWINLPPSVDQSDERVVI